MNINPITSESTKAEEKDMLRKMRTLAGTGTYLADLFNDNFLAWADDCIKNDFPVDAMAVFETLKEDAAKAYSKKVEAKNEAARLTSEYRDLLAELEDVKGTARDLRKERDELKDKFFNASDKNTDLNIMLGKAENDLALAREELVQLKAKLYDYMTKEA